MNWDQIRGKWQEVKGKAKEKWGKLTHRDLEVISGRRDRLLGRIRQIYGLTMNEAHRQVGKFRKTLEPKRIHIIIKRKVKRVVRQFGATQARMGQKAPARPRRAPRGVK